MFGLFGHGRGCECRSCKPSAIGMRIRMKIPMDKDGNPLPIPNWETNFIGICGIIIPLTVIAGMVLTLIYHGLKELI